MYRLVMRTALVLSLFAFASPMLGCKGKADEQVVEKPKPKMALEGFEAYAGYLPADAIALVVIDGRETLDLLELAMPPERPHNKEKRAEHLAALERDVNRTMLKHYGVDFALAERVIIGASDENVSIILLGDVPFKTTENSKTVGGMTLEELDSDAARDQIMGKTVWTMAMPDKKGVVLLVGDELADNIGASKTLASQPERVKSFKKLFATAPELGLSLALQLDNDELKQSFEGAPFPAPDAMFFQADKDIHAVFIGSDESLNGIKTSYESAVSAAGAQLSSMRSDAKDGNDPGAALSSTVVFHTFNAWRDSILVQGPAEGQLAFTVPSPAPERNAVLMMAGGLLAGGMFLFTGMATEPMPDEVILPEPISEEPMMEETPME